MNAKKRILIALFSTLFLSLMPLEMTGKNYSLKYATGQQHRKNKPSSSEREIQLTQILERIPIQFPDIRLYQSSDGLTAYLSDNSEEINAQIIGDDNVVYYDGLIGGLQSDWELDTDFLPEGIGYTIEFRLPAGGYLVGEFECVKMM